MTSAEVIDDVIAELETRVDLTAWQQNPWLAGELVLDIDEAGNAELRDFLLHYDTDGGLRVERRG